MNPPGLEVYRILLEKLCARSRIVAFLADVEGRISWADPSAADGFPGAFSDGESFQNALDEATLLEPQRAGPFASEPAYEPTHRDGELRRVEGGALYRHLRIPLEDLGPGYVLHCLVDISHENELEEHSRLNFQQLSSMREIVDILYESLSTPEVVYLCLVAVSAQVGFGFNRAFFLQVNGPRMRGRIGIGPSDPEEAHQIWSRLSSLHLSSLREIYQDLTRNSGVPDPRTQELAVHMDFDLSIHAPETGAEAPGILGVLGRGKPARLHSSEQGTDVDDTLFELLATDEVAVVPLFVRDSLAGVIIADNFITRKPIAEGDLNVLKTFAGYAGVALERSHLYDELRESVAKLQAANETLKTSQQKLLQAEKLSAIGGLAAHVSHEIRNPLVAIGGLARSLLKDRDTGPETAETLQIIVSEVTRLEKFLRETLDFVKPQVRDAVSVDLNAAVLNCLATFKSELLKSAIKTDTELPEPSIHGWMDSELLHHVLSNLLKNAIEAMPDGGRLYVAVRRNDLSATIHVGDTGTGIPPEVLPRIFDAFFTTKPEGTGLGLCIAQQSLRSLGGTLELEADDKFRTVFKLTLPVSAGGGASRRSRKRSEMSHARMETVETTARSLS